MNGRILIVDDEEIVIRSCLRILVAADYEVDTSNDGLEALRKLRENNYDVLILDIKMPKMDGLEVLQRVKEAQPDIDVIMITGLHDIETAVQAMKMGAFDYLPKPFDPDEFQMVVERAFERRNLLRENISLKSEVSEKYRFDNIIGISPPMQSVYRLIARCAPTNSTVMLRGDSGTGKELIARAVHYNSLRKAKAFVPVDCTSLSEGLLESELFGHVRGSFTGAVSNKMGLFQMADGGTLFLDEIGNISLSTQAKLLRFIEEREFKAVGDTRSQSVNVRLITATNRDLEAMVADGAFREDLYYRINIFPIEIPPLRERRDDIPALAFHFLNQFSKEMDSKVSEFSAGAMNLLMNHDWAAANQPGCAQDQRGTQTDQENCAPEISGECRKALRARGAEKKWLERDPRRRTNRNAAQQFPGVDGEIRYPDSRGRAERHGKWLWGKRLRETRSRSVSLFP